MSDPTHLSDGLAGATISSFDSGVFAFRRFLKIETERLRIRHRLGLGGREIASGRSDLVDLVVGRACQHAAGEVDLATQGELKRGCAVVALGGYGRRELSPFSDVDLLFLHEGSSSRGVEAFVEQVLLLLWDMGLTVGHSFRSVSESVVMAREDLHSRNALAEARLVTGSESLFLELEAALDESVYRDARRRAAFLEAIHEELRARQAKFGRVVCVQEPNVKESPGGLRDLHAVVWAGRVEFGARDLDTLRQGGHLSASDHALARRAYDFVSRVRNEAHFATFRRADLLTLDLQPTLAKSLGYEPSRGMQASEVFMRDYYRRAHELHHFCAAFFARIRRPPRRSLFRPRWRRPRRGPFEVHEGKLLLVRPDETYPATAPAAALAFTTAQQEGVTLDEGVRLAIRGRLGVVDAGFRHSREAGAVLLEILGKRGRVAPALRAMHETGFLGRLLPEFARVTFLVQHDFYHRYTVDEHTLTAIQALDEVAAGDDPALARFHRVLAGLEDAAPLYLGLLLHDIGKGRGGGHVPKGAAIAERICRRLDLPASVAEDVVFLVRSHLVMSHVSQRRDLTEARVVDEFATAMGTPQRLDMLLLLTYADTRGVGPDVWSEWKGTLLWDLYTQARERLKGAPAREAAALVRERFALALAPEFPASEVERHLAIMPERYLRALTSARLAGHLRLVRTLAERPLAAAWRASGHHTELTVCGADRPGFLARIAGTLTAAGADILSVDVYTREDGVALDTFLLTTIRGERHGGPERWAAIEEDLAAALEDRLDVAQAVERGRARARPKQRGRRSPTPPAVRCDAFASDASTVVEVRADDQPGLVYRITQTLASLGLDIAFAKIATEKSHVLDVFYVNEAGGDKLRPERMAEVERALGEALEPPRA